MRLLIARRSAISSVFPPRRKLEKLVMATAARVSTASAVVPAANRVNGSCRMNTTTDSPALMNSRTMLVHLTEFRAYKADAINAAAARVIEQMKKEYGGQN